MSYTHKFAKCGAVLKRVWFLKLQSGFIEKNIVQAWGKWLEMKERHVRNLKWSWKVYIDLKTAEEIIFKNVASDIFGKSIIHRLHVMTRIWFDMIWMVDLTSVPVDETSCMWKEIMSSNYMIPFPHFDTWSPPMTRSRRKGIIAQKSTRFIGCLKNRNFLGEQMNLMMWIQYMCHKYWSGDDFNQVCGGVPVQIKLRKVSKFESEPRCYTHS